MSPNQDAQETAEALLSLVQALVGELHPGTPASKISLDSSLDKDLGLDSLGRVELMSRIERRFDVVPPERLFAEAETTRDLMRALLQASSTSCGSTLPDVESLATAGAGPVPQGSATLLEALDWHAARNPDRTHIRIYSDEGEGLTLTYLRLKEGAAKVAAGLQAAGIQKGQAVAIMLPTGPDYFYSFIGALMAGGVPVPMYPPPRMSQLEEHLRRYLAILGNCGSPLLVTVPEARNHAKQLCALVESLTQVASVDELSAAAGDCLTPRINAGDIAFLQYTSGSTGNPKGVVLTHANLLANIRAMGKAVNASPDDVFVSWLPLYHDMGLIGAWLGSLYHAMPLVVMPPLSFLSSPKRWFHAIHRYRGTLSASPNFGYETCLRRLEGKDIEGLDLSSWRIAFNGAEAVVPETVERFVQRFGSIGFSPTAMMPVYGLAESSVGLAFPPLGRGPLIDRVKRGQFSLLGQAAPAGDEDRNALRFVACGLPLPEHQIRVVDEAGRELPERRQGRIEFRGPSATSGYFQNSKETRALFHDGWLNSGDLGYIVRGELYVTGRIKDIVIRAGRNIYPHEVEEAVGEIEGVRKGCVAVFGGVDAATGTERLIVLAETRRLDAGHIEDLRGRVTSVVTELIGEPPDDVVLAPPGSVLKTSSGKIRRAAIRQLYERGDISKSRFRMWLQSGGIFIEGMRVLLKRTWVRTKELLFAGYAWSVFYLLAPVVWTSAMVLPTPATRWRVTRGGIRLLRWATRTPLVVHGLENLPPEGEPCVFVANHSSYLDAYAIIAAVPRRIGFVAKEELRHDKLLAEALRRVGTEFVERFEVEQGVADARRLTGALKQGKPLLFFPEGGFSRRPGLLPFHLGAFVCAEEAGTPVIPIALRGTRNMLRGDEWFPRRGSIHVSIGKPLSPSAIKAESGGDSWKTVVKLRELSREYILRHAGDPDLEQGNV